MRKNLSKPEPGHKLTGCWYTGKSFRSSIIIQMSYPIAFLKWMVTHTDIIFRSLWCGCFQELKIDPYLLQYNHNTGNGKVCHHFYLLQNAQNVCSSSRQKYLTTLYLCCNDISTDNSKSIWYYLILGSNHLNITLTSLYLSSFPEGFIQYKDHHNFSHHTRSKQHCN